MCENKFRKVEAMWRKNYSIDEIVRATRLPRLTVLDITQTIFGRDMKKRTD